jgi:protein-O-mannosyltransferase-like protein
VMGFMIYVIARDRPKVETPVPAPVEPKPVIDAKPKKSKAPAPAPAGINLFDRVSTFFVTMASIVLTLLLLESGATASYIVLVVIAFLAIRFGEHVWRNRSSPSAAQSWQLPSMADLLEPMNVGAVVVVGSVASITYLAVFLPHYYLGWWGGISDLFKYYKDVVWYEQSVSSATHPYSSRWWSWPLMLRPIAYWQSFPKTGDVQTVWGGGNPLLWWGALTAIMITAVQALERPNLTRWFLVIGYLSYLLIWAWIGRTLFLYHYMASVYFGYLALAILLADCFNERAEPWEHLALLLTMAPVIFLGLPPTWAWPAFFVLVGAYFYFLLSTPYVGRYVASIFVVTAAILFVYYFPVWVGMPISRTGYYARMWLQSGGIFNWI